MDFSADFPRQTLSYKSKGDKWRRDCVDWAATRTYFNDAAIRRNVVKMKINYDLVNGVIHMDDLALVLNPGGISTAFVPEKIQHYPILNSKLNTLRGEEASRVFDWRVIVTNPYAISKIEEEKKRQLNEAVRQVVEDDTIDDELAQRRLQEVQDYFSYDYQDAREIRANELLKHYSKEQNFSSIFNKGFMDACICANEIYCCSIVGGEPVLEKWNPLKLRFWGNGSSNRVEDSDVVVYEDYWSRGRIVDTYYDELSAKDIKRITDEYPDLGHTPTGAAGNYNEAYPFYADYAVHGEDGILVDHRDGFGDVFDDLPLMEGGIGSSLLPYDVVGNIRVTRVWWKSKRKIYSVKSFDPETGDEVFEFYPETYIPDEDAGEVAEPLWVNEAWEGTKIGDDIYVGIRPCLVQHNSMSNPSRCHFGIVGTIYNVNEMLPYSLVDMMKPYSYFYDATHAKLVDLIATNWGKIMEVDLALKPKDWEVDKWFYFARANKTLIIDSFNEGTKGAATGKLAGGLNNASKGYIDADWGNSIQNYMNILQWTKDSMSDLVGINRQREGNIYNRETVGGVERAVLQSSYITDWLFQQHDDTKRRVLTCFLEEAKGAMRGRKLKFQYILSDGSTKLVEIDGDDFCECDYGLVVDNSNDTQKLNSQIDALAQAAVQNQYKLSTIARLYSSISLSEKVKLLENTEKRMEQQQQEAAQQQQQLEQQKIRAQLQAQQMQMQQQDMLNQRDNQTKIDVAEINSRAEYLRLGIYENENNEQLRREELQIDKDKLRDEMIKFDKELQLKKQELDQKKAIELKKIAANKNKQNTK